MDSVSSTATNKSNTSTAGTRKSSVAKNSVAGTTTNGAPANGPHIKANSDTPSYMKPTNSAQRKINDR